MTTEPSANSGSETEGFTRFPSLKEMVELLQADLAKERQLRQDAEARVRELEAELIRLQNP